MLRTGFPDYGDHSMSESTRKIGRLRFSYGSYPRPNYWYDGVDTVTDEAGT